MPGGEYCIFAHMDSESIKNIQGLLEKSTKIVIIPHKNPDGDAVGSTLALAHFLKGEGHTATVVAPNDFPGFLKWLPEAEKIVLYDRQPEQATDLIQNADLIFTLDFNHLGRAGALEKPLSKAGAPMVMIDHHQQPDTYAAVTFSDPQMSSTCEMVFHFISALGATDKIGPEIASCLYTGIMTDTGSFKFAATTSTTHRVIAQLIDCGARHFEIHSRVFDSNSADRIKLLGIALNNMEILPTYRTAIISLSQDELDGCNFKKGDTEGFVNYGLSLKDYVMAVIFIENKEEGIIKISFRSKGDFSVNHFAREHFNGGGHTNAAGGRSTLSLEDTIEEFKKLLPLYQKELHV